MPTLNIAPLAGLLVSMSTGAAVDGAVKLLVPSTLGAIPAFAIKIGTGLAGNIVGGIFGAVVVKNLNSVLETLQITEAEEPTEDN